VEKTNNIRKYSKLVTLDTFEDRYKYLRLFGNVAEDTFGFDRYLNQKFYRSQEWKRVRDQVIVRDNACDLGCKDRDIFGKIYIHHMNPINIDDIEKADKQLFDPEYLVCVSMDTHNAIHYGNESFLKKNEVVPRTRNDTCPWKLKKKEE